MEKALKPLGRETIIIGADSSSSSLSAIEYLLGDLLSIFRGNSVSLLQDKNIIKGHLGN